FAFCKLIPRVRQARPSEQAGPAFTGFSKRVCTPREGFPLTGAAENRDQERLALLVRAGEIFHQSLDVTETLHNVARSAVETFADLCLFDLIDERSDRLF